MASGANTTLTARVRADTGDFDRNMRRAAGSLESLKGTVRSMRNLAVTIGVTVAAREALEQVGKSITLASNLNETLNKSSVIFGRYTDKVLAWSKSTEASLALTQQQILDITAGFSASLSARGLVGAAGLGYAKDLTELSADLASFYNTTAEDAAAAISSALRGERDPIERFNVFLTESTVKQEALRLGLVKGKGPLSEYAKTMATLSIITRQTAAAQGDLDRTSGSAANQMRQFRINVDTLKTSIGAAFLPLIELYLPRLNDWLRGINVSDRVADWSRVMLDWAAQIEQNIWPKLKTFFDNVRSYFTGADGDKLAETMGSIGSAFANVADGMSSLFGFFNNMSPETKEALATIVLAGAAWKGLSTNPVVKIGVELTKGAISALTLAANQLLGRGSPANPMFVVALNGGLPGGLPGGGGKGGKWGKFLGLLGLGGRVAAPLAAVGGAAYLTWQSIQESAAYQRKELYGTETPLSLEDAKKQVRDADRRITGGLGALDKSTSSNFGTTNEKLDWLIANSGAGPYSGGYTSDGERTGANGRPTSIAPGAGQVVPNVYIDGQQIATQLAPAVIRATTRRTPVVYSPYAVGVPA